MDALPRPNGTSPRGTVAVLFDELCLRWAREADVVVQQTGALPATLVLLPRDKDADEVAIRIDGLRGNLLERSDAIVAELSPQAAPHDPAGLVLMLEARLGMDDATSLPADAVVAEHSGSGTDGAVVYVSLGHPALRRALGFRVQRPVGAPATLVRLADDPPVEHFAWLDGLLRRPDDPPQ